MIARRTLLAAGAAAPFASLPAVAQDAARDRRLREDWADLARYAGDDRRLIDAGTPVDIVFMGDSITQNWVTRSPGFFGPGRVGRGISGQTTPQMLVRMMADVVHLRPRVVHIMAGTNDVAGNTGPMTAAMTQDNLAAMAMLARANGIRVIHASIPPAAAFPWRPGLETRPRIAALNAWLRDHARRTGATWVDYHPALATADGAMRRDYAEDGVHPNAAGYDAMNAVLEPVLARVLRRR